MVSSNLAPVKSVAAIVMSEGRSILKGIFGIERHPSSESPVSGPDTDDFWIEIDTISPADPSAVRSLIGNAGHK